MIVIDSSQAAAARKMHKMDPWTLPMTPYPLKPVLFFRAAALFSFIFDDDLLTSYLVILVATKTLVIASDSQNA